MKIKEIIQEEVDEFNWANSIEPDIRTFEYYIINSESLGGDLQDDEWVLLKITNKTNKKVYYKPEYINLHPNTSWNKPLGGDKEMSLNELSRLTGIVFSGDKQDKPHWFPIDKEDVPEPTYPNRMDTWN